MNTDRPPSEAVMSEYIQGFDAGYSFVLHEIEKYIMLHDANVSPHTGPLVNLLTYLQAGDKSNELETQMLK